MTHTPTSGARRLLFSFGLAVAVSGSAACYSYRAMPNPGPSLDSVGGARGAATDLKGEVVWSLFWGVVQETPTIDNCNGQDLVEVKVSSNPLHTLLKVITVGLVAPSKIEWRCALPNPDDEEMIGEDEPEMPADSVRTDTLAVRGLR